jgi:hypothetical protein
MPTLGRYRVKKAISYVHLLPGGADIDVSGQDTRDILELPVMTLYRPKVGMVVPFERAPEVNIGSSGK